MKSKKKKKEIRWNINEYINRLIMRVRLTCVAFWVSVTPVQEGLIGNVTGSACFRQRFLKREVVYVSFAVDNRRWYMSTLTVSKRVYCNNMFLQNNYTRSLALNYWDRSCCVSEFIQCRQPCHIYSPCLVISKDGWAGICANVTVLLCHSMKSPHKLQYCFVFVWNSHINYIIVLS